ncbi:putative ATP-dependent RNA helicase DDX20 [Gouania willdenowi]|nr:probable ATP-dependent RNA helicase DDX20 [Gouania willdenowi]
MITTCVETAANMAAPVRKAAHDVDTRKRSDDVLLSEGIDFGSLLLSPAVLDGLSASGFQRPSPIQLKAIPLGRCGLDLIVQAKSGTGKTCVFCTIALDSLVLANSATQVLVLAPTREIAVQIHSVAMAIGCAMEGLECHVFIGGTPVSQDKAHLKKCHIAVGSPGRIKQLIELGILSTSSIRLFVLDEADKLLEEGSFQEQINWIFSSLPVNKQMLALSATYPESLAQHLTHYMREPTFVRLNPKDMGLKGLKQYYKLVQSHPMPHKVFEEKVQHLLELFSKVPFNQALVFSNFHSRAQHLADILSSKGLPAACISGGLTQDQRLEAMSKLKQYQCRVLISTDLTSRGIDAEKVNLVINLDVPQDWETYMHRIGRAGRYGTQGLAVTYCCHGEEENKLMAIAQKCSLSLSLLPSTIEPGLMDEPCDWDVCTDASTPDVSFQLFPKKERKAKRSSKSEGSPACLPGDQTVEHRKHRKQQVTQSSTRQEVEVDVEEKTGGLLSTNETQKQSPRVMPTRKELQDALPKIPPLSSFKSPGPRFMTLEEAEWDFHNFMTTGLGRSVEVIRQFKGQEEDTVNGQNENGESVILFDDSATKLKLRAGQWQPNLESQRSLSVSSSSGSDVEDCKQAKEENSDQTAGAESRAISNPPTETRNASSQPEPKAAPTIDKTCPFPASRTSKQTPSATSVTAYQRGPESLPSRPTNQTAPPQPRREGMKAKKETRQKSRRLSGKMNQGPNRERNVQSDEEEEWGSDEANWTAHHRAWNDYYSSWSASHDQHFQNYYSSAYHWMAAYRMNAVYMAELLKH